MTNQKPDHADLVAAIRKRIEHENSPASREFAPVLTNLALSTISSLFPEGWEIVSTPGAQMFPSGLAGAFLAEAIAARFRKEGPPALMAHDAVASRVIAGISDLYPEGWAIVPAGSQIFPPFRPVAELVLGTVDGIEDGISRWELLTYLAADYFDAGHEVEQSYRGKAISIAYGIGDVYVQVNFGDSDVMHFHVTTTESAGPAAVTLRDIDTWIDARRAFDAMLAADEEARA